MRAILLLAVLAAVPDREAPTPREKPKSLQEQLLGEWRLENASLEGLPVEAPLPKAEVRTLQFTPTEIVVRVNGEVRREDGGTYKLDAAKTPVFIDLTPTQGADKKLDGILRLEGERLTLCFSLAGQRPADFNQPDKSQQIVLTLKRVR